MELLATGFNAWNQLDFGTDVADDAPDDLHTFTRILAEESISQPTAALSYTHVETSSGSKFAGCVTREQSMMFSLRGSGITWVETAVGTVLILDAGSNHRVHQYLSIADFLTNGPELPLNFDVSVTHITAYDTGFAALTDQGEVYTWGDPRYPGCLGRAVSPNHPAEKPGKLDVFEGLGRVSKIAARGYLLAAVTADKDLYIWGCQPGRQSFILDLNTEPAPVVIDDRDVVDVGVGESHIIVLTGDDQVYVIGENGNGQLGLPVESADSWTHVDVTKSTEQMIVGVAAGPRNSFILLHET